MSMTIVCLASGTGLDFWCFQILAHPLLSENCSDQKRHMKWDKKNKNGKSIHKKEKKRKKYLGSLMFVWYFGSFWIKEKKKTRLEESTTPKRGTK